MAWRRSFRSSTWPPITIFRIRVIGSSSALLGASGLEMTDERGLVAEGAMKTEGRADSIRGASVLKGGGTETKPGPVGGASDMRSKDARSDSERKGSLKMDFMRVIRVSSGGNNTESTLLIL